MNKTFIQFVILIAMVAPAVATDVQYKLIKEIPIAGEGTWGRVALDEKGRRLYLPHETKIEVLDIDKEQIVGEVVGLTGTRSMVIAPKLKSGLASNSRDDQISAFDLRTLKTTWKFKARKNPSYLTIDPDAMLCCFDADNNTATVFEADDGDFMGTITLPGKPESATSAATGSRTFCAISDKNQVITINPHSRRVTGQWPVAPGEGPCALAIDSSQNRLFVGCRNKLLLMLDGTRGNVVSAVDLESTPEKLDYDAGPKLVFVAGSDGALFVFHMESPVKLSLAEKVTPPTPARCIAVDPKTHKLYVGSDSKILVYGSPSQTQPH